MKTLQPTSKQLRDKPRPQAEWTANAYADDEHPENVDGCVRAVYVDGHAVRLTHEKNCQRTGDVHRLGAHEHVPLHHERVDAHAFR